MKLALLVFLGGGIGSVLRWLTGLAALRLFGPGFPAGTLAVNLAGCLLMGVLARVLAGAGAGEARLLLLTGVLGGFTTFSAFALDTAALVGRGESGPALVYVLATLGGTLLAVALGLWLGDAFHSFRRS